MTRLFLVLVFLVFSSPLLLAKNLEEKKPYYVCACTMFQNEARYIKEWIEYNLLIGVDHFYLYNNDSVDDYQSVLQPYIDKGIVEVFFWPSKNKAKWVKDQLTAFNDCIKRSKGKTSWLTVIDIDEYIVPVVHPDLPSFLSQYDHQQSVAGVRMNWQLYGTSHLKSIPEEQLLIEALTLKAPTKYWTEIGPHNGVFKTIFKPHTIKNYNVHYGILKKGYHFVPTNHEEITQPVEVDEIRINHYWTRAEDFFYATKVDQRVARMGADYYNVLMKKLIDLNKVEDKIIFKYLPEMKKRMGK